MRWLNKLANTDKHRVLIPAFINHSRIDCRVISNLPASRWEWLVTGPRALHVGTPVVRVTLERVRSTECEVQVDGSATIHPSLGYGTSVTEGLALIETTVREVLAEFDELL